MQNIYRIVTNGLALLKNFGIFEIPCIYEKYLFPGQALDKMAFFRDKH